MRLAEALRLGPAQSIAFIGAGGKSAAIARLAAEVAEDYPVVVSTTTRLARAQSDMAESHVIFEAGQAPRGLTSLLKAGRTLLVTGPADASGAKWLGLAKRDLTDLWQATRDRGGALLIEADGAKGRSWKAPAEHEPVIPAFVDIVVPVVGLNVLGRQLTPQAVHRPERVAYLLGVAEASRIEPQHIADLMRVEGGSLKGVPHHAEVRVLLNRVNRTNLAQGRAIASKLLVEDRVQAVLLGSVMDESPVIEAFGRVAGVILAAGGSSRLAPMKQLIEWRGEPLVSHAVRAALAGGLSPIGVVVGASAEDVERALSAFPVRIIQNAAWRSGQSSSVRAGLSALGEGVEAVVYLLADMPFVSGPLVETLVQRHRETLSAIVAPWADGRWANPVLFDRVTFPDLQRVSGDRGGKPLFERFPTLRVPWDSSSLFDVDSPEDLDRLQSIH